MNFLTFDDTKDFSYYKHNPKLSKGAWFILLMLIPVSLILYIFVGLYSEILGV